MIVVLGLVLTIYILIAAVVGYVVWKIYRWVTDDVLDTVPASEKLATIMLAVTASGALVAIPVTAGQIAPLDDSVTVEIRAEPEGAMDLRAPEGADEIKALEDLKTKLEEAGHEVVVLEEDTRIVVNEPDPHAVEESDWRPDREPPEADEPEQRRGVVDAFAVF